MEKDTNIQSKGEYDMIIKLGKLWIMFSRYGKDDAVNWNLEIMWWN